MLYMLYNKGAPMFIVLSPGNPDPMYRQVTDQIKDAIAAGDLKPSDKLPSIREIAEALKVSAITIKRAYLDLENEGYIFTRAGLGSFVAEIDREGLRSRKLGELRKELTRILKTGAKFGISADDIVRLIREAEEE
jgi:GntR family transcriptional regulator